jgi:hypothetical protein
MGDGESVRAMPFRPALPPFGPSLFHVSGKAGCRYRKESMNMDPRIAEWLASGDTGSSSKAIMLWLSARQTEKTFGPSVPSDAGDLGRCLRLLGRIPEWKSRMPEMTGAGGYWPTFARRWDEIVAQFMEDCGGNVPAKWGEWPDTSKTYALMRQVMDEARETDKTDFTEVVFDAGSLAGCSMKFSADSPFAEAFAKMGKRVKWPR